MTVVIHVCIGLLVLVCSVATAALVSPTPCYPLTIHVFDGTKQCQDGQLPSAQGLLYADGTCRSTTIVNSTSSYAASLLPGRYVASCVADGSSRGVVQIPSSGCLEDTCQSTNGVCNRDASPASYYSRLNPPAFSVNDPNGSRSCLIMTGPAATIVFTIVGDCTAPCTTVAPSPVPTSTPNTELPLTMSPSLPSYMSDLPSPAPVVTRTRPPSLYPVQATPPSAAPVAIQHASPSLKPSIEAIPNPTRRPSTKSPTINLQRSTSPPSELVKVNLSDGVPANNRMKVVIGSFFGLFMAVLAVLGTGYLFGVLRQKRKSAQGKESPASGARKGWGKPYAIFEPAMAPARTEPYTIWSEVVLDHPDDVSTLEAPTAYPSVYHGDDEITITATTIYPASQFEDGNTTVRSSDYDYYKQSMGRDLRARSVLPESSDDDSSGLARPRASSTDDSSSNMPGSTAASSTLAGARILDELEGSDDTSEEQFEEVYNVRSGRRFFYR